MATKESKVSRMPERPEGRDVAVRGGGISSLRNEINRVFDRFWGRGAVSPWRPSRDLLNPEDLWFGRDPFAALEGAFGGTVETLGRADLSETDEAYELQVDLPGMKKGDVSIDYAEGVLSISGERKDEREDKRKGYYLSERSYGACHRSFRVPESVDHDHISAQFKDGVLTVTLPKTAEAKKSSRRIEVKG